MTTWILFSLGTAAFALLALGMERHTLAGSGHRLAAVPVAAWRAAGSAGLLLMLAGCIAAWGPSIGTAAWCGLMTGSAMAVVLSLTYGPMVGIGLVSVAAGGTGLAAVLAGLAM